MSSSSSAGSTGFVVLLMLLVTITAVPVSAQHAADHPRPPLPIRPEPTMWQKTGDALIVRPLLVGRFIVGVVSFPIVWPVAALLGDDEWAFDVCIEDPADRLFRRPLGRL